MLIFLTIFPNLVKDPTSVTERAKPVEYAEASKVFEQFVEIDTDVLGRLGLGEAYIRLERFQDAIVQFEKAGEVSAEALLGIDAVKAILCCRNGEFEVFKELFLKILGILLSV